jgi:hypothetical protein
MADVVEGIARAVVSKIGIVGGAWPASPAAGVDVSCGGAACAECCFTRKESIATETTGKNKIIQRIFIEAPIFAVGWNHIVPGGRASSQRTSSQR